MKRFMVPILFVFLCLGTGCKNRVNTQEGKEDPGVVNELTRPTDIPSSDSAFLLDSMAGKPDFETVAVGEEIRIRQFLLSTPATFGWETRADKISFDFFPDGRLHIQGPDGEASMWSGKWTLTGNRLTLERTDLGTTLTMTVRIDGQKLLLDDRVYTRYVPYRDK